MMATVYRHDKSDAIVHGKKLAAGEKILPDDVYNSSDGKWRRAGKEGMTVPVGTHVVWVRPERIPN